MATEMSRREFLRFLGGGLAGLGTIALNNVDKVLASDEANEQFENESELRVETPIDDLYINGSDRRMWNGMYITVDDCNIISVFDRYVNLLRNGIFPSITFFPAMQRLDIIRNAPNITYMLNGVEMPEYDAWILLYQEAERLGAKFGYHTTSHFYPSSKTKEQLIDDYTFFKNYFEIEVGVSLTDLVRPPYGDNSKSWNDFVAEQGLKNVMWDSVPNNDNKDENKIVQELDRKINTEHGCIWLGHTRNFDIQWLESLSATINSYCNDRVTPVQDVVNRLSHSYRNIMLSVSKPNINKAEYRDLRHVNRILEA